MTVSSAGAEVLAAGDSVLGRAVADRLPLRAARIVSAADAGGLDGFVKATTPGACSAPGVVLMPAPGLTAQRESPMGAIDDEAVGLVGHEKEACPDTLYCRAHDLLAPVGACCNVGHQAVTLVWTSRFGYVAICAESFRGESC